MMQRRTTLIGGIYATLALCVSYQTLAMRAYRTLFQELRSAQWVIIATTLTKEVDSITTLYRFRIDTSICGSLPDTVFSVMTFEGRRGGYFEEERFTAGHRYLLFLSHSDAPLKWDTVISRIYLLSNAYYAYRSFPDSQRDYKEAVYAIQTLLPFRVITDTAKLVEAFLGQLKSMNSLIQESAIGVMLEHRERRSLPELRRLTHDAASEVVRERALTAIDILNGENEGALFYNALRDTSAFIRGVAIMWFARRDSRQGEDALISVVADTLEYLPNRIQAAEGLLRRKSTRSVPTIEAFLHEPRLVRWNQREIGRIVDSLKSIKESSGEK